MDLRFDNDLNRDGAKAAVRSMQRSCASQQGGTQLAGDPLGCEDTDAPADLENSREITEVNSDEGYGSSMGHTDGEWGSRVFED